MNLLCETENNHEDEYLLLSIFTDIQICKNEMRNLEKEFQSLSTRIDDNINNIVSLSDILVKE